MSLIINNNCEFYYLEIMLFNEKCCGVELNTKKSIEIIFIIIGVIIGTIAVGCYFAFKTFDVVHEATYLRY